MRSLLLAGALAVPFLLGAATGATDADDGNQARVELRLADPDIVESSGLVVTGHRVVTTNDSGDTGRVFTVDARSGKTVGVTTWDDDPTDVEALAPAGPGRVWVGDIGDNTATRDSIEVTSVPVGPGERSVDEETIDLVYPDHETTDGHDAEALLAQPGTGRLYVATKDVMGGQLYAAPERLADDEDNELRALGPVTGLVTDGAFFPDGEHLVLRNYTTAVVYAFPSLAEVGSFALPSQPQGEGVAVGPDNRLWLSSEGSRAKVWSVGLPPEIEAEVTGVPLAASPTVDEAREPIPAEETAPRESWQWFLGLGVFVAAVVLLVRSLKPH